MTTMHCFPQKNIGFWFGNRKSYRNGEEENIKRNNKHRVVLLLAGSDWRGGGGRSAPVEKLSV